MSKLIDISAYNLRFNHTGHFSSAIIIYEKRSFQTTKITDLLSFCYQQERVDHIPYTQAYQIPCKQIQTGSSDSLGLVQSHKHLNICDHSIVRINIERLKTYGAQWRKKVIKSVIFKTTLPCSNSPRNSQTKSSWFPTTTTSKQSYCTSEVLV